MKTAESEIRKNRKELAMLAIIVGLIITPLWCLGFVYGILVANPWYWQPVTIIALLLVSVHFSGECFAYHDALGWMKKEREGKL